MALTFPRGHRILGVPATTMKTALRAFSKGNHPGRFLQQKSIFPSIVHGGHAYEIAIATDLIDPDEYALTDVGLAVARSRSVTKQPVKRARDTLAKLIEHIKTINADPDRDITVERVYLYGSVMRNEPTVGDVDLQIEVERGPKWAKDFDGFYAAMTDLVAQYSPSYNDHGMMGAIDKGFEYIIFGHRKAQILAGAQINAGQLELIPAPCQLIYTATGGVNWTAPIAPNHPDFNPAEEGSDQAARLDQLPEAQIDLPRPVDARFITQFNSRGWVGLSEFAPTYDANIYLQLLHQYCGGKSNQRLFANTESNIEILQATDDFIDTLDPRRKVLLSAGDNLDASDASFILERENTISDDDITIAMNLSNFTIHSHRKSERQHFFAMLITAACIHAADRFHALQLQEARENPRNVTSVIKSDTSIASEDIATANAISSVILDHLLEL
ncbi:nucleotidyltransferase domain-containing protein [Croceicoccus mobilis]|uniref:Uncharacterized protein n=1 Tax=Croceicoccus mobilis TaxID=1703339 RepID=A0A916Z8S1_9SPHN|nr:nucleotidyltransferase domain-containing protein [Croceicoccus mobilis]GGD81812.1 hypothetical protein GCM10010990_34670 [Croceicoccus mobilis]